MGAGQDARDALGRILKLSPECDPTSLHLSAGEGYLLSRIDGHTPWRLLREMGGMDSEEVDLCLEGWLASGLLLVDRVAHSRESSDASQRRGATKRARSGPRETRKPVVIDETLLEEGLEIDIEVQRRILSFEANLDLPYHQLLGIAQDADSRQVKRAYFDLSKEFHPDRYFRRNIGGYVSRLEGIFKKILEAHEILSDPKLREEISKSEVEEPPSVDDSGGERVSGGAEAARPEARPLSKIERLRQRMPFKIPEHVVSERRQKATEFYKAARQSESERKFSEAVSSIRIAICFDPYNAEYKSALGELHAKAADAEARRVLDQIRNNTVMDYQELEQALKLLEDVILYRPHDPETNSQAAMLALELEKLDKAFDYARTAVDHSPDVAAYRTMLGSVYRAQGDIGHAKNEFESALKIDPNDLEARKAVASLRLGRRAVARGG